MQTAGSRDHVLEVLPTPALKGEGSEGMGDGDWWVCEHARQVCTGVAMEACFSLVALSGDQ